MSGPRVDPPSIKIRLKAILFLISVPLLAVPTILWYGLPVLWRSYPSELRVGWKMLVTGRTGPYRGIRW